jgi:hypothetical protein
MKLRKCVIALSVVTLLTESVNQSKAAAIIPVPVAPASAIGAGGYIAGGFIGVVAVLCLYDIWLKMQGLKNWDGTPKSIGRDVSTGQATGKRQHGTLRTP